jgi:glycosyltransferase involved in cell wall biosynthesis
MHILLVHQLFLHTEDAGMTQHHAYARHLVARGHRVTVLAGTRSYLTGEEVTLHRRQVVEPGLEIIPCRQWGRVHRSFAWRTLGFLSFMASSLVAGLRVPGVDVVWTTSPPLPQVCAAWALSVLKGRPWVFEIRDVWPEVAVQMGVLRNPLLVGIARIAERFLYRRADRLVVNSPGFLPHLAQHRVSEDKIEVVPNGVELEDFDPQASGAGMRAAHCLEGRFVAMYAGAHGMANDLMTVLRAADRLRDLPEVVIVLVGDGREKARLMAAAESMALENVRFLPAVPRREIPGMLAAADCGLAVLRPIPLFATVYPNKVFDYMAAGKPVVLGIGGVIRDLIEDAGAGIALVPGDADGLAQAIRSLAGDRPRGRAMGARGRACVEARFDREHSAERMERILTQSR